MPDDKNKSVIASNSSKIWQYLLAKLTRNARFTHAKTNEFPKEQRHLSKGHTLRAFIFRNSFLRQLLRKGFYSLFFEKIIKKFHK